ncbi:hypothetical protein DMI65_05925 [Escherichia coli]|nr:hypothetical protein [Escherichia coli]
MITVHQSQYQAGQKIVFDVDVEHGPLPITMLMHGNVIPALAARQSELSE